MDKRDVKDTLAVVIPAYREAENLEMLIPKLHLSLSKLQIPYEIVVVDAVEPTGDNTGDVCDNNGATYILRTGGNSYGDAIRTGINYASQSMIAIMDADGSHIPDDLARMVTEKMHGGYDIVIGSRYVKGGKTNNGLHLVLMSRMVNVAYQIFFGIRERDVSNSFRVYDAEKLQSLELLCNNFDVVEEILIMLRVNYPALSVKEIPVTFDKRQKGESKRDLVHFVFTYFETINRLLRIRKGIRKSDD